MKKRIQPHILCGVHDIAKYVFLPGDPKRSEKIASFFDECRKVAEFREYVTYPGKIDNIPVSVTSTGIGCPSAAIAVEELANIGAEVFIDGRPAEAHKHRRYYRRYCCSEGRRNHESLRPDRIPCRSRRERGSCVDRGSKQAGSQTSCGGGLDLRRLLF